MIKDSATTNFVKQIDEFLQQVVTSADRYSSFAFDERSLKQLQAFLDADAVLYWRNDQSLPVVVSATNLFSDDELLTAERNRLFQTDQGNQAAEISTQNFSAARSSVEWTTVSTATDKHGLSGGMLSVYFRGRLPEKLKRSFAKFLLELTNRMDHPNRAAVLNSMKIEDPAATKCDGEEVLDRSAAWDFLAQLHRHETFKELCYFVVNEVRDLHPFDRITLLRRRETGFRVVACSGVAEVDRQSDVVQSMERLVSTICRSERRFSIHNRHAQEREPQIQKVIDDYLEASTVQASQIIRLDDHKTPLAALICEDFRQREHAQLSEILTEHLSIAVHRSIQNDSVTGRLSRHWSRADRFRLFAWTQWIAVVISVVIGFMVFARIDFAVRATGHLLPSDRRNVFAPLDGTVLKTLVKHGDKVREGQILAKMRSAKVELELKQIQGELRTVEKELSALSVRKLQRSNSKTTQESSQLIAEELALSAKAKNLSGQIDFIQTQLDRLTIRSPVAGTVLNWGVENDFKNRPVRRGQPLLQLADLDGEWTVELQVPDRRLHHVINAANRQSEVPVQFVFHNAKAESFNGGIQKIGMASVPSEDGGRIVPVQAHFKRDADMVLRPGIGVSARIACGRRSPGFVWFHQIYEAAVRGML